jgi:hypothetical protein
MTEELTKLRPDRDLQCYFYEPSAMAALSGTSATGFTVSGSWRQQFDWAVLEWNRDNVFEHPALRNLPDGDLSGLSLSYLETRVNCIPFDSLLYPTIDWPYLRVWADANGQETIYRVPLLNYATPTSSASAATAQFELQGTISGGDYIELAWLDQHFNYQVGSNDTLETAVSHLATVISNNQSTGQVTATTTSSTITLTYLGMQGSNGNRVGVYGTIHGTGTQFWAPSSALFSGGVTPGAWAVNLNFGSLMDVNGAHVPTNNVRKLRWTWAADQQPGTFERSEFSVTVTNWNASGNKLAYSVAGPGSMRIEDYGPVTYSGMWNSERGNYSGGSIHSTALPGASVQCSYNSPLTHVLYLGTRSLASGAQISIQVDGGSPVSVDLALAGEDVLVRMPLGSLGAGQHEVTVTHSGAAGSVFYFDFLEIAVPTTQLPVFAPTPKTTLATDWDTEHSQVLAPERTAWLLNTLGFRGRANHYAGCLWFYELVCAGQQYASTTITFTGTPEFGKTTSILLDTSQIDHINLIGDTAESMATCFALLVNAGSTAVWANADGATLTIYARAMGTAGNGTTVTPATNSTVFTAQASSPSIHGGMDGKWLTDLNTVPRINRAARDWTSSFLMALKGYGIAGTVSFSMELGNGDDSRSAGIAQRYPSGAAAWLNTPSLQTNFGPESTGFWQQVYLDMAQLMSGAGMPVYLQFGEVQWWYFCPPANPSAGDWTPIPNGGMPFYDTYTTNGFEAQYGIAMHVFTDPSNDPTPYPNESAFLPSLVGTFTKAVQNFVRNVYPSAVFEVLYPPDVNDAALTKVVNLPKSYWTPSSVTCLKTENFSYTANRDLDEVRQSLQLPEALGFAVSHSSHLAGIGDYTTPWVKEWSLAIAAGVESVVLFALDQFCLIGYSLPMDNGAVRSGFMGG